MAQDGHVLALRQGSGSVEAASVLLVRYLVLDAGLVLLCRSFVLLEGVFL